MKILTSRHNKGWTKEEVKQLKVFIELETPLKEISLSLGRTEESIKVRASREGLSVRAIIKQCR